MHGKIIVGAKLGGTAFVEDGRLWNVGIGAPNVKARRRLGRRAMAFLVFSQSVLVAATPDPDLFDGRVAQSDSKSGVASSIKVGGGDAVKTSAGGDSGGSGSEVGQTGEIADGSDGGAGTMSGMTEPGSADGSAGAGDQTERSFEDFGFGVAGTQERVEVNRSKESNAPMLPTPGGASSRSKAETEPSASISSQNSSGGTRGKTGSQGGDFGTNLPSGL